jgi:hypothetical protein
MALRITAWPFVVPRESFIEIRRAADVVAIRIASRSLGCRRVGLPRLASRGQWHFARQRELAGISIMEWKSTRILLLGNDCAYSETEVRLRGLRPLRRDSLRMLESSLNCTSASEASRPSRSSPEGRAKAGWEAGIRTPVTWSREPLLGSPSRPSGFAPLSRQYLRPLLSASLRSCAACLIVSAPRGLDDDQATCAERRRARRCWRKRILSTNVLGWWRA